MRPVPQNVLLVLLLAICSLCAVQWWRESILRESAAALSNNLIEVTATRDELASRMKTADSEILRLTVALSDLRANSVSRQVHEEVVQADTQLRESIAKQNAVIKEAKEAIARQNTAIQQANENIRKLAGERDDLAKRANELTALYNKRVEGKKPN